MSLFTVVLLTALVLVLVPHDVLLYCPYPLFESPRRWGAWGPCTHSCGSGGTRVRYREDKSTCVMVNSQCQIGKSQTGSCPHNCKNGGTPHHGYCSCGMQSYGTCCEHTCPSIDNCERLRCTSGTNYYCERCEYNHGNDKTAFRLVPFGGLAARKCEKLCSWRPDSSFCFPGVCPDIPSSCTCSDGFTDKISNCMIITNPPTIDQCPSKVINNVDFDDVDCLANSQKYSSFRNATGLEVDFMASFQGPSGITRPYYINKYSIGLVKTDFFWQVERGGKVEKAGSIDCDPSHSKDNANSNPVTLERTIDFGLTLQHADVLRLVASSENGGFVQLNNYDNGPAGTVGTTHYYMGQTNTTTTTVIFDYHAPEHCSSTKSCPYKYLDVGKPFTKRGLFTVRWQGWNDALSGIQSYQLKIYTLHGDQLLQEVDNPPPITEEPTTDLSKNVTLPKPGVYSVQLDVEDVAGNIRYARTFVLFDDEHKVQIKAGENHRVFVTTAASNTTYQWLTRTDNQVSVNWVGHFTNNYHHQNKLLSAIDNKPLLEADYETRTGQPPNVRSTEAIPNVEGVTGFDIQYRVDHAAGKTIEEPSSTWVHVPNFLTQTAELTIPRSDGDSVRVFIKAMDVVENEVTDSVLVHFDSSPPDLIIIGVAKNGYQALAVHNTKDLFEMKLEFEAYDDHSGLYTIAWRLHDSADRSRIHGSGQVAVEKYNSTSCHPPVCGCVPAMELCYKRFYDVPLDATKMNISEGVHDYDYIYTITVINNAKLQMVRSYQVTVDTSPPHTGVVKDSNVGQPDVDYQSHMTQHASWEGFFDKESGVMLYQYGFSYACLNANDFSLESAMVQNTTNTWASRSVPGPGRYHVTVVAYNHAFDPSDPVCSDGVVIDITSPSVFDIHVQDLYQQPGLATDENTGEMFFFDRDRTATMVTVPDHCREKAVNVSLDKYVIKRHDNGTLMHMDLASSECEELPTLTPLAYLRSEHMISWHAGDEDSSIAEYQVGLSRTSAGLPDTLPYQSTHGHRHFTTYHSGLSHDQQVYIHLRARNKAGLYTTQVIGPVQVEGRTPSGMVQQLKMDYHRYETSDCVNITWTQAADEEMRRSVYSTSLAIVEKTSGTKILDFVVLTSGSVSRLRGSCPGGGPFPGNLAVSTRKLQRDLHPRHQFQVVLRIETAAGNPRDFRSTIYVHDHGPPIPGLVKEVISGGQDDVDIQTNQMEVRVAWTAFYHRHESVHYLVQVLDMNHSPMATSSLLNRDVSSFTFNDLALLPFQKYYGAVTGLTVEGNTTAKGDGVIVLSPDTEATGAVVYDGPACHDTNVTGFSRDHHVISKAMYEDDIDFLLSRTKVSTHWKIPTSIESYVKDILWRILNWSEETRSWSEASAEISLGMVSSFIRTDLSLTEGKRYPSAITFCHEDGCFMPVFSNGFDVISSPPTPAIINVDPVNDTASPIRELHFMWTPFTQPHLGSPGEGLAFYEWTVLVDHAASQPRQQLFPWRRIPSATISNKYTVNHTLDHPLSSSSCYVLMVRGVNKVGLAATAETPVVDCSLVHLRRKTVMDAVGAWSESQGGIGNIKLARNALWSDPEREFTPSLTTLQAVWPGLRHDRFLWKVVSGEDLHQLSFHHHQRPLRYQDYHCSATETLACGETEDNYVNVPNLALREGVRYFTCIYANATVIEYEKFQEALPTLSACSDGIVVDNHGPLAGTVWTGDSGQGHTQFQTDPASISVHWNGFSDIEVGGDTALHTGIAEYQVAVGTYLGGTDTLDFSSVSIVNDYMVNGLLLQQGQTYFATIKAFDFVGRTVSVSSPGITIDTTSPEVTGSHVSTGGTYHGSVDSLRFSWHGLFHDPESGIVRYDWCIGSRPGHCDLQPFITSATTAGATTDSTPNFLSGHKYYITVKATNGAGLRSQIGSRPFIIDTTPPFGGFLLDGPRSTSGEDADCQNQTRSLTASWDGFYDAESGLFHYVVSVGTAPPYNQVMDEAEWGLTTTLHLDGLSLRPGQTYHTVVRACNWAGVCRVLVSDGITPDVSPPVIGRIFDGPSGLDINYQASRTRLCAHWSNMHDVHSGITQLKLWAGTSRGSTDILQEQVLDTREEYCHTMVSDLPLNTIIYTTVEVINGVGQASRSISDGFIVDTSPPNVNVRAHFASDTGSIKQGTQALRTSAQFAWEFSDLESEIHEQYISLEPEEATFHHFPTLKLPSHVRSMIYPNVSLYDGERYRVKVIGCNGAGLCTTSLTEEQLVDSSPPRPGAFAARTDHSIDLGRHRPGQMIYEGHVIKLALVGFSDPQTFLQKYYVTAGTEYDSNDLMQGAAQEVNHTSGESHRDEGAIQKVDVTLSRPVVPGDNIYVAVWAENGVDLLSRRLHGTFRAVTSSPTGGILELVRRCAARSCEGHCTCAPQDQTCAHDRQCVDVTGATGFKSVVVFDTHVTGAHNVYEDIDFTYSQCTLAAIWYTTGSGAVPHRYEWSVSQKGETPGTGVLDLQNDPIWTDNGNQTWAVFSIKPQNGPLISRVEYIFHVRAWYTENEVAVFTSDGVLVDATPPAVSRSKLPKEVTLLESPFDIDVTTGLTSVNISWRGVFMEPETNLTQFKLSIGRHIGGSDVTEREYDGHVTEANVAGLHLSEGIYYYTTLSAYNQAGLMTTAQSDGFQVDMTAPGATSAVVQDGHSLLDESYQRDATVLQVSWHGFYDLQSAVHHYIVCAGTTPGSQDVFPCTNVGAKLKTQLTPHNGLIHGQTYYTRVQAVDTAGHVSDVAVSDGVTVDLTPPEPTDSWTSGSNLVLGGSFETDPASLQWVREGRDEVYTGASKTGSRSMLVYGSIRQDVNVANSDLVRLTFWTLPDPRHHGLNGNGNQQETVGHVTIGSTRHMFVTTATAATWQRHIYFTRVIPRVPIILTFTNTNEAQPYLLDDVSVEAVHNQDNNKTSDGIYVEIIPLSHEGQGYIVASWKFTDPESEIIDYKWAIGTVRGGVQIQRFQSTGLQSHGRSQATTLSQGLEVHVTVTATNGAGLTAILHSVTVKADFTPPEICCLKINEGSSDLTSYVSTENLSLRWSAEDAESAVAGCEWGLGSEAGDSNIVQYTQANGTHVDVDMTGYQHGAIFYLTIRCTNVKDLTSYLSSAPVIVVSGPPEAKHAWVNVIPSSTTQFPASNAHQAARDHVMIGWTGFRDSSGIKEFQVKLETSGHEIIRDWLVTATSAMRYSRLDGLNLQSSSQYTVSVRAVNHAGYVSDAVSAGFIVDDKEPAVTGHALWSWWDGLHTVHLNWTNVFGFDKDSRYEVNMGTQHGGYDVLRWIETKFSVLTVTDVDHTREHFVTITAINQAGLYATRVFELSYA